jgi:hypothetical protein
MPRSERRLAATSFYLDRPDLERVDVLAKREGISRAAWVRRLVLAELRTHAAPTPERGAA